MGSFQRPSGCIVLVVEDEPLVRSVALDIAEDVGCEAFEAGTADEALRLLEEHADINVLFTDIEMPGSMSGLELSHLVRERWPHIAIIMASGRTFPKAEERPEPSFFLQKPYSVSAMMQLLENVSHRRT